MIKIKNLAFEYFERDEEGNLTDMVNAIREINFDVQKGDFVVIAGKNGSGKSTLAKILNRLLVPIEGSIIISGMDAMREENTLDIRKEVGMVFQNPDDQLIGTIVAEDVAFGAENIGVPQTKLWERVYKAIEQVGLTVKNVTKEQKNITVNKKISELSGGEKQKVAIAGVLAMEPQCIVLDESTSMLDPASRNEILSKIKELNQTLGITVILITHIMEELFWADYIYVMEQGKIALKGSKEKIFSNEEELKKLGLELPQIVKIKNQLVNAKVLRDTRIMTPLELAKRLKKEHPYQFELDLDLLNVKPSNLSVNPKQAILFDNVSCQYKRRNMPAISHINLSIGKGEFVAIVGKTGAGKSTLLQTLVGFVKPQAGNVYIDGVDVYDKTTDLVEIRRKVGYIFQYPEKQLFGKNVYEDVVFGPRNVGISEIEAEKRAYEAIELVGLSQDVYDIPIQKLSGGQKRRVALAGVLAMRPEYLILDEPLAGLDPAGKEEMLSIIHAIHKEAGITILMVSHDYDGIGNMADRVVILNGGEVEYSGEPEQAFYAYWLREKTFEMLPTAMELLVRLRLEGLPVDCFITDEKEAVEEIIRNMTA